MDFASLKDQVSNLRLYDIKAGVRKVQNAVMNYTEMEAKVREATNNDPWGTSASQMQEIANGTFNYQLLNEIMPMIYKRFTEKTAEEWRQIYKALQLLEFLIKNGSERVIDDARSHLSLLKMLRQFHYIDQNGKDQGINVRNRSKELTELLSDVDRIRAERKKARATRNKYGGVEGGMGMGGGGSMSGGSRYGGFGSEDAGYGGYSGGVYGDGGGFGGNTSGFSDTQSRRDRFEEYDEYDEGAAGALGKRQSDAAASRSTPRRETKKPAPPKPKEPEVDLFSFGDDEPSAAPSTSNGKAPASTSATDDFGVLQSSTAGDDDEFDDFQSATPSTQASTQPATFGALPPPAPASTSTTTANTQFAAPQPRSGAQSTNINDLFASISPVPSAGTPSTASAFSPPPVVAAQQQYRAPAPSGYQAAQPNYFTSVSLTPSQSSTTSTPGVKSPTGLSSGKPSSAKPASKSGGDAFSDLLAGASVRKATPTQKGMTMADMAKQKASAGIWGAPAVSPAVGSGAGAGSGAGTQPGLKKGSGLDDLLG